MVSDYTCILARSFVFGALPRTDSTRPSRPRPLVAHLLLPPVSVAAAVSHLCSLVRPFPAPRTEEVRDLLSDNPKTRMEVKEDPEKGVFIKNLSYPEVTSVDQIEALMNFGNKNRSVGATAMNATSSRSHSLFTVRIETSSQVAGSDEAHIKAGKRQPPNTPPSPPATARCSC